MVIPGDVILNYKRRKYKKCIELIKCIKENDELVDNFVVENAELVCEALACISRNDGDEIYEMQERMYMFYEKVSSVDNVTNSVPLEVKLTASYNLVYWLLFYCDAEVEPHEEEEYLELINSCLRSGIDYGSVNISRVSDKVFRSLRDLIDFTHNKNEKIVFFVIELVAVIILYLMSLKKTLISQCVKVCNLFVEQFQTRIHSIVSVNKYGNLEPPSRPLFKFSFSGEPGLVSDLDPSTLDYLVILESTLLFLSEDFRGSLKTLQRNTKTTIRNVWNYLVILNSFQLENWTLCSGFISKMSEVVVEKNFKTRLHIIEGKLKCSTRSYKEGLIQFKEAAALSPNCAVIYYYMGHAYGKMELNDCMVESFEKLIQTLKDENFEENFKPNLETVLLDWIHPFNEITQMEAYYALAVAYGLDERFRESAEAFENVLQALELETVLEKTKIVELPNMISILHEASLMNLLVGNLVRAEQLAQDSILQYVPQDNPKKESPSNLSPDVNWLQRVIQQELLEIDLEPKELPPESVYSEDLIFFFPENVIGLLILSEIQRIQEVEDYKSTLSKVFSIFSKFLSVMSKKENLDEKETRALTLVKALAGKTCLKIAGIQMKLGQEFNVEKMYKRALSCNKGDRDALFDFYSYLLKAGKRGEASKLWNTFFSEKVSIVVSSLPSFALRYFLTDKTSERELDNVQRQIDSNDFRRF